MWMLVVAVILDYSGRQTSRNSSSLYISNMGLLMSPLAILIFCIKKDKHIKKISLCLFSFICWYYFQIQVSLFYS